MKRPSFLPKLQTIVLSALAVALCLAATLSAGAQTANSQLSLADILIALRSKKVTLPDRNKILTEAIAARGTTFSLTPEIEKELTETGADKALLASIRSHPQVAKVNDGRPKPFPLKPQTEPIKNEVAAPPPVQDTAFFEKRANDNVLRGDLDAALFDFTKATEKDGSSVSVLMGRGHAYAAKKSFALAIADFTKVIELDSKNASAFAARAEANEKQGDAIAALNDYRKAFELDPTIETAKAAVERYNAEQARLAKEAKPEPQPVVAPPPALPEFLDLGLLNESQATKLVKPMYPANALHSGWGGQVTVEIEIDPKGNVTKAKAVSGNMFLRKVSEDAAAKSQFKPAMVGTVAIKAKARIVYDFQVR